VQVECEDDRVTDRVGFREIAVCGEDILLNGKSIYLRGVCVHVDDVELGKATSEADLRRRAAHAKELGCNLLRLAHYPHHERIAEIADEVGLLLWEKIPVYWAIDFSNRRPTPTPRISCWS
jgi:beta-glucuronidase